MNLIPIQLSDLKIGQPLSWDLFDQGREPIRARGYITRIQFRSATPSGDLV